MISVPSDELVTVEHSSSYDTLDGLFNFADGVLKFTEHRNCSGETSGIFWSVSFTMKLESFPLFGLFLSVLLFVNYSNRFEMLFLLMSEFGNNLIK